MKYGPVEPKALNLHECDIIYIILQLERSVENSDDGTHVQIRDVASTNFGSIPEKGNSTKSRKRARQPVRSPT
jgi:hypothetical protein